MQTSFSRFRFLSLMLISCVVALASAGTARAWWCDNGFHKCAPACGCCCKNGCTTCSLGQASVPQISSDQTSMAPVRYFDGDIRMTTDDMSGGASPASLWGHTRIYTNQLPSDISEPTGSHWLVRQWPLAKIDGPNTVTIIFDPLEAFWFDLTGGVYVARYGAKQTLVDDTANGVFRMTYPDGTFWEFYDLTQTAFPKGQFKRRVTPGGDTAQVSASVGAQIRQLTLSHSVGGATYEQYDYSYGTAGGGNGQLASVQLSRANVGGGALAAVRNVNYSYYTTGSGTNGLSGDLKLVECQTPSTSGGGWTDAEVYYYRYYLDNSSGQGFAHGMRRAFFPAGYQALVASQSAGTNLDSLPDSTVAPYSCLYFQYDGLQRVTFESTCGGATQLSYSYTPGAQGTDYNVWAQKTTESLLGSGGTSTIYTKTVYSNFVGQVLLTDVFDTTPGASGHWIGYWRYDGNGHQVLAAEPSAVANYPQTMAGNWNQAFPVTFTTTGLVHETTYYPTTTAGETTPGGAATYPAYELVRQAVGNSSPVFSGTVSLPLTGGTAAVLSYTQYFAHSGVLSIGGSVSSPTGGTQMIFPTAVQTTYSDPAGSGTSAITSSSSFAWYPISGGTMATLQMQQVATVLPPVPASENGAPNASSGTAAASAWVVFPRLQFSNSTGDVTWSQDERGRLTHNAIDSATGLLTETVMDVSGTGSAGLGLPSGWNAPADGQNVISDFQYDSLGRTVQTLGPAHVSDLGQNVRTAGWTVYDDANHIVRSAQGYIMVTGGSTNLVNPVSIQMYDPELRLLQSISATRGGNVVLSSGSLASTDTFAQSSYVRWSINYYSARRLNLTANYFLIPSSGTANKYGFVGSAGTLGASGASVGNFNVTQYAYQTYSTTSGTTGLMGQQNKTQSPGGTITRTVLDVRGQPTGTWIGTNDTGAIDTDPTGGSAAGNNMVQVSSGTWNVDSTLAQSAAFVSASTSRTAVFLYDWRDRRYSTETFGGLNMTGTSFFTQFVFDNLDRVTETDGYANGTASANLISKRTAAYDPLSRAYQQQTFAVDITSGTVGNALTASTWFDAAGNVRMSKMAGSGTNTFTKTVYDGLTRSTSSYSGYCNSGGTTAMVPTLVGSADVVFQQSETTYDPASNAIFMASRSRLATSGTASTGGLDVSGGTLLARSSYSATWQDAIGRTTAVADFGINGGTAMTVANRQTIAPLTTSSGTLMLVSATIFNARGEAFQSVDPKGRVDQVQFDDAGRTQQAWQNFISSGGTGGTDQNISVQTAYTMDGQVATLTASNGAAGNQLTQYAYGTTTGTADSIARSDLLKGVIYPDSTNAFTMSGGSTANGFPISGTPTFSSTSVYDRVQYTYNRLGEQVTMQDQNSTVHAFSLDGLGRPTADSITASGPAVNTSVLQIARSYEVRGMLQHVTSYANSAGAGTPVNDTLMVFNSFGQLASEYQAHAGAVVSGGAGVSPAMQYAYANATANTVRPTSVIYSVSPSSTRSISFAYNLGTDDNLSRLSLITSTSSSTLAASSGTLAQFSYLGLGQIVTEGRPSGGTLDYSGGAAANYSGFDNFDRVIQQVWLGSSGTLDQFNYSYDVAGNRLTRQNVKAATLWDEQYAYDHVYRVNVSNRGTLSGGTIATPVHREAWGLDPLGNWATYSNTGTLAVSQTRSHNAVNELTAISGTGATTLSYDQAGNTLSLPKSTTGALALSCTYDAWNRLMVTSDGTTVMNYAYDGLGRRTQKISLTHSATTDYYLSGQQVVETDFTSGGGATALQYQYVWSPRYIDAPILRDDFTTAGATNPHLYYLNDANFNVTSLVAPSGSVVERCVYDAYGTPTFFNATWSSSSASTISSVGNTALFTGRELDPETGLYYYRARYYSPGLGRFIGRDPVQADENFYRYCGNDPLIYGDPTGLWKWVGGKRQGHSRATMCPAQDDTTQTAAEFARLEPSESAMWLRDEKGNWVAPGQKIDPKLKYNVPNTVVIAYGEINKFSGAVLAVYGTKVEKALQSRGFSVDTYSFRFGSKQVDFENGARDADTWGLAMFGHGWYQIHAWYWPFRDDSLGINGQFQWSGTNLEPPAALRGNHKLAFEIAYFCSADLQPYSSMVSSLGKYYGCIGLTNVINGPTGVGYWGTWDGLVGTAAD